MSRESPAVLVCGGSTRLTVPETEADEDVLDDQSLVPVYHRAGIVMYKLEGTNI